MSKMRRLVKVTALGLIGLLIAGLMLFPRELFVLWVKWQCSGACVRLLHTELQCEKVFWREGKVVFQKGVLRPKACASSDFPQIQALFEEALFTPQLRSFLGGNLRISGLKVAYQPSDKQSAHTAPPSHKRTSISHWLLRGLAKGFPLELHTVIEPSEIFLCDLRAEHPVSCHLYLSGTHYWIKEKSSGNLSCSWGLPTSELELALWQPEETRLTLAADFHHYSLPLLSQLLCFFSPPFLPETCLQWDILQGTVEGHMALTLSDRAAAYIETKVHIEGAQATHRSLKLLAEIDQLDSTLALDLASSERMTGSFVLKGGRMARSQSLLESHWDLKNLDTEMLFCNGQMEKASLQGQFLGMHASFLLDSHAPETLMTVQVQGHSQEIQQLLPEPLRVSCVRAFPDDFLALHATLKKEAHNQMLHLSGSVSVTEKERIEPYLLNFGCLLGVEESYLSSLIPAAFMLQAETSSSTPSFFLSLKEQLCLSKKRLGWFQGQGWPLEKFLAPFLFRDHALQLTGQMDFEGQFDEDYLVFFYKTTQVNLKNSAFSLTTEQLDGGVHYLDLKRGTHLGTVPLRGARYLQSQFNCHLEEGKALVYFDNQGIYLHDVEVDWEGIHCKGKVALLLPAKEPPELYLSADSLRGSIAGLKESLQSFQLSSVSSLLWQLPVEAVLAGNNQQLNMHYRLASKPCLLHASFVTDLVCQLTHPLVHLDEFLIHLEYDSQARHLTLSQGSGQLRLSTHLDPLKLEIPEITLYLDTPTPQAECLAHLFSQEHWLFTLNAISQTLPGGTQLLVTGYGPQEADQLSFSLLQQDDTLYLQELLYGIWRGEGKVVVQKESLQFDEISFWSSEQTGCSLSGSYDLLAHRIEADIHALRWDLGHGFTLPAVSPPLNPSLWHPQGEIVGTGKLAWNLKGELTLSLTAACTALEFGGIYFGDADALCCHYGSYSGFSVEGLEAVIATESGNERYQLGRFHYDPQKERLRFEGFSFSLPPENLPFMAARAATLFPGKIHPSLLDWVEALKQNEPLEGALSIEISPSTLWVYLTLKDGHYYLADNRFDLKKFRLIYDPVQCEVTTEYLHNQRSYWIQLSLDSATMSHGTLSFSEEVPVHSTAPGREEIVASWQRNQTADQLGSWSIQKIEGSCAGVTVDLREIRQPALQQLTSPSLILEGEVMLDMERVLSLVPEPWHFQLEKWSPKGSLRCQGRWSCSKQLLQAPLKSLTFSGRLLSQPCQFLGIGLDEVRAICSYTSEALILSHLSFKDWAGTMDMHKVQLQKKERGWQLSLDHLACHDVRFSRLKSHWLQPDTRLEEELRLSRTPFRSLLLRSLTLNHLSGILGDAASFVGSGSLDFTTFPKRTLLSNLLFLPTEITARIGLDLTSLIPASGSIDYELRDGKIYLKKFCDVYSEGKHSRFYLAKGQETSIDFHGNLNLHFKMKQYNILMKFTEFFTLNIKGSVLSPTYSLSKYEK